MSKNVFPGKKQGRMKKHCFFRFLLLYYISSNELINFKQK